MCLYSIYTLYAFNTLCVFSTSSVCIQHFCIEDFPGGSDGKASAYNVGDQGSIPELERSPGEGMATHSSLLAWKIPWMEEAGRLQSMGSQRVGHN